MAATTNPSVPSHRVSRRSLTCATMGWITPLEIEPTASSTAPCSCENDARPSSTDMSGMITNERKSVTLCAAMTMARRDDPSWRVGRPSVERTGLDSMLAVLKARTLGCV
jgi:hypothetical protein